MSNEWLGLVKYWKNKWPLYLQDYQDDTNGLNLYTFIEILNKNMSSSETIVCDAGSALYVSSQNLKMKKNQRFVLSGAQADMGFAVPASLGVYLADKTKNVLVITGDGSFNTNIQELATIKSCNAPIKIFIWNNNGYLSIKNTQKNNYENRVYGTSNEDGLWFPEIENIAKAYNFDYFKIKSNIEFENNYSLIINNQNPTLIEVICKSEQEIVPTLMLKTDKTTGNKLQCGLEDMYPFLDDEELKNELNK